MSIRSLPSYLLVPSLLFSLTSITSAQSTDPLRLSLQDAVQRAVGAAPEVNDARRDLSLAKATLHRSRPLLPDDPQLAVGAYHSTLREDIFNEAGELVGKKGYGPNYTLGISQEFEIGGQRSSRIAAAEAEVEKARLELSSQRRDLVASVKTAFVHALISEQKLELARQSFEAMNELATAQPRRSRAGESQRVEQNLLSLQVAHTRREFGEAQQQRAQAYTALGRLCRIPVGQKVELVGKPESTVQPLATLPQLLQRAASNRSDLLAAERAVNAGDANLEAKKAARVPNVTVSASVSQFAGATLAGGEVSVPVPIFQGHAADVEEAIAERNHSARHRDLLQQEIVNQVTDAFDACNTSAKDVETFQREIIPLNEDNLRLQKSLFSQDEIDLSEWIGTQVDSNTARGEFLTSIEDYATHLIELERTVGGEIGPDPTEAPAPTAPTVDQ